MTSADIRLLKATYPADVPVGRGREAEPWHVRAAGAVHGGAVHPGTVTLDALLVLVVVTLAGGPFLLACLAPATLVASGRIYRDRDRVVARGVGWWPRPLVGSLGAAALLVSVLGAPAARTSLVAALALCALLLVRIGAWLVLQRRRQGGRDLAPCLVVGGGDRAATLARTLERHADFGLVAFSHSDGGVLADPVALADAIRSSGAAHVFLVADGAETAAGATPPLRRALGVRAHVSLVPTVSDALLDARAGHRVGGVAVLPLGRPLRGPTAMPGKRAMDAVAASLLLLIASPVLLLAALAVKLDDGGPVLYRQRRTGRHGRPFDIVKLRTMRKGAHEEQGNLTVYNTSDGLLFKMSADPRVTRPGRFLRRSGVDELPQLLNVVRGEMSLVGPRPLPVEAEAFSPRDGERHLVRPGMTGLWQVSGGSSLRYREMVDLDLAYVHGWSPGLDLQVLLSTVAVLLGATVGRGDRAGS